MKEAIEVEVEVFRAGDYGDKGKYTEAELKKIAETYDPRKHHAPVTVDHAQSGPACGWVERVEAAGQRLLAVMKLVPDFAERVRKGEYLKRSVEIYRDFMGSGAPYLKAISFLGAMVPEVKGMPDPVFASDAGAYECIEFNDAPVAAAFPGLDETETSFRWRVRDPEEFEADSFRTVVIKEDKPRIEAVVGVVKGQETTAIQSLIFPKEDGWTAESVQQWLAEHEGEMAETLKTAQVFRVEPDGLFASTSYLQVDDSSDPSTWRGRIAARRDVERVLAETAAMFSHGGFDGRTLKFVDEAQRLAARRRLLAAYRAAGVPAHNVKRWAWDYSLLADAADERSAQLQCALDEQIRSHAQFAEIKNRELMEWMARAEEQTSRAQRAERDLFLLQKFSGPESDLPEPFKMRLRRKFEGIMPTEELWREAVAEVRAEIAAARGAGRVVAHAVANAVPAAQYEVPAAAFNAAIERWTKQFVSEGMAPDVARRCAETLMKGKR